MTVLQREYFELVVVREPIEIVVRAFDTYPAMKVSSRETPFVFPTQVKPTSQSEPPSLLWSPRCSPHLTAFMPASGSAGYFPGYAKSTFRFEVVTARSSTAEVDWINEFSSHNGGVLERVVRSMQEDPRPQFFQQGTPYQFEDVKKYRARRIRDRLQRQSLISYLEAWGAPVNHPNFWSTDKPCFTFARKQLGPLKGRAQPTLRINVEPSLWEHWRVVGGHLEDALQFLVLAIPSQLDVPALILTEFDEHLANNRLELAMNALAKIAIAYPCQGAVWGNLERAAESLNLLDRAAYFRQQFLAAIGGTGMSEV